MSLERGGEIAGRPRPPPSPRCRCSLPGLTGFTKHRARAGPCDHASALRREGQGNRRRRARRDGSSARQRARVESERAADDRRAACAERIRHVGRARLVELLARRATHEDERGLHGRPPTGLGGRRDRTARECIGRRRGRLSGLHTVAVGIHTGRWGARRAGRRGRIAAALRTARAWRRRNPWLASTDASRS